MLPSRRTEKQDAGEANGRRGMTRGEAVEIGLADQPTAVVIRTIPSLRGLGAGSRPPRREARGIDGHAGQRRGDHRREQEALPPAAPGPPCQQIARPAQQHQLRPVPVTAHRMDQRRPAPMAPVGREHTLFHRPVSRKERPMRTAARRARAAMRREVARVIGVL